MKDVCSKEELNKLKPWKYKRLILQQYVKWKQ